MTQIISVSPSTAAYAAQAYKTTPRSATALEQEVANAAETAKADNDRLKAERLAIKSTSLDLALLTMQRRRETNPELVARLYAENAEEEEAGEDR
ncbi:hypothetical protein SAMN05892877_11041 [Rhizobium subbaraonis]|uniref:Uncharacterized protein n=1 Tax=Rhizobium subbaraonis TaxID=908946 RepID=A0A285UL19_9HYPH|nr:hypothetical protein [Rhizobium subbaraonis]SOC42512.1 hypothetical protein SAMN05892877_11041 [Rhizobium subbaraonis]